MSEDRKRALLVGIDTCGAVGSMALARVEEGRLRALGEQTLTSGEFAGSILVALERLLTAAGCTAQQIDGVVVVHGPGSYTGIRVGVATAKGLADGRGIPLLAVSRLRVMEQVSGVGCVALDAWRGQMFVGLRADDGRWRERLVTAGEFSVSEDGLRLPGRVAVCEESVAQLLETVAEEVRVVRVADPGSAVGAAQALETVLQRWLAGEADDAAALDGHYLRGSEMVAGAQAGQAGPG